MSEKETAAEEKPNISSSSEDPKHPSEISVTVFKYLTAADEAKLFGEKNCQCNTEHPEEDSKK